MQELNLSVKTEKFLLAHNIQNLYDILFKSKEIVDKYAGNKIKEELYDIFETFIKPEDLD